MNYFDNAHAPFRQLKLHQSLRNLPSQVRKMGCFSLFQPPKGGFVNLAAALAGVRQGKTTRPGDKKVVFLPKIRRFTDRMIDFDSLR
jgi:hypothetical protein